MLTGRMELSGHEVKSTSTGGYLWKRARFQLRVIP